MVVDGEDGCASMLYKGGTPVTGERKGKKKKKKRKRKSQAILED